MADVRRFGAPAAHASTTEGMHRGSQLACVPYTGQSSAWPCRARRRHAGRAFSAAPHGCRSCVGRPTACATPPPPPPPPPQDVMTAEGAHLHVAGGLCLHQVVFSGLLLCLHLLGADENGAGGGRGGRGSGVRHGRLHNGAVPSQGAVTRKARRPLHASARSCGNSGVATAVEALAAPFSSMHELAVEKRRPR